MEISLADYQKRISQSHRDYDRDDAMPALANLWQEHDRDRKQKKWNIQEEIDELLDEIPPPDGADQKMFGQSIRLVLEPKHAAQNEEDTASVAAMPPGRTLRRARSSQSVDGTITRTPSQASWRDVPQIPLAAIAKHSQKTAVRVVAACKARRHPYKQRTMAKRP